MKPIVLALDLATTTGWAVHSPGMDRPHFGSVRLSGQAQEVGRTVESLRCQLSYLRSTYGGFTHIVFEAQHVAAGGKMNVDTIYRLIALGGMTEWYAHRIGARCYKVHISEWRKHFLGRGTAFTDKGQPISPKELAVRKCAEYGWHMSSHDAAEACGVLDYFLSMINGYVRPWRDAALMGGM